MDKADVNSLRDSIEHELKIIAEHGLNSNNFDTAYKLTDMLFKLQTIKVSCDNKKSCYEAYMNAKRHYRFEHTPDNQNTVLVNAKTYMEMLITALQEMLNDCDCESEKEILKNYISKL